MKKFRLILIFAFLFILFFHGGCSYSHPLFSRSLSPSTTRKEKKKRSQAGHKDEHFGVVSLGSSVYQLTTGGVPDRDFETSTKLNAWLVDTVQTYLEAKIPGAIVHHPLEKLQQKMDRYHPAYNYIQSTVGGIYQMYIARNVRKHLEDYSIPEKWIDPGSDTYSRLIFFSASGFVGSAGYQAATWAAFVIRFLLGSIAVPVMDAGYIWVMIVNMETREVTYFNTNLPTTQHITLSSESEGRDLIRSLLKPYVRSLNASNNR